MFPLIERIIMIGAPADNAVARVPGGLDTHAINVGRAALEDLYRKLSGSKSCTGKFGYCTLHIQG